MASNGGPPPAENVLEERYELRELLGRGGMGEVWSAWDRKLRRQVALKLLSSELAANPEIKERFKAEAFASARLGHPNVVGVYDTGEHKGIPYLVMELLSGRTLADELSEGPMEEARIRRFALEVLGGLAAAHESGIVHRDIKPGNVLLGSDGSAKLADFGIAKGVEGIDLTQTGALVGTPAYLAPERVQGEPATAQSDLYSLGVVLYEACSGVRPFLADTAVGTAYRIQNHEPPPLLQERPDLDPNLVSVVERAMSKDPAQRFASAADMADALSAVTALAGSAGRQSDSTIQMAAADGTRMMSRQDLPGHTEAAYPGPVRVAWYRRPPVWVAAGLAIAALSVVLFIGSLSGRDTNQGPNATPTSIQRPADQEPLPADLERAMRRLEEAVDP